MTALSPEHETSSHATFSRRRLFQAAVQEALADPDSNEVVVFRNGVIGGTLIATGGTIAAISAVPTFRQTDEELAKRPEHGLIATGFFYGLTLSLLGANIQKGDMNLNFSAIRGPEDVTFGNFLRRKMTRLPRMRST